MAARYNKHRFVHLTFRTARKLQGLDKFCLFFFQRTVWPLVSPQFICHIFQAAVSRTNQSLEERSLSRVCVLIGLTSTIWMAELGRLRFFFWKTAFPYQRSFSKIVRMVLSRGQAFVSKRRYTRVDTCIPLKGNKMYATVYTLGYRSSMSHFFLGHKALSTL